MHVVPHSLSSPSLPGHLTKHSTGLAPGHGPRPDAPTPRPRNKRLALLVAVILLAVAGPGCRNSGGSDNPDCGNGTVETGEQCDDGNTADGDGCSATCTSESVCGNGTVEAGEACDDGNTTDGDGCESDCTVENPEVFCKTVQPIASGVCEVTPGDGARLLIGDVLAPDALYRGGEVLVDSGGQITCVGCDCADQAAGATTITCPSGVISPGLINSHDHLTFIQNDPYNDTGERYEHRHDWRRGRNGHTEINASGGASGDEIRWGELRYLMGGATSTIGSGGADGFLRNLDRSNQEGLDQPQVNYETFPLGDTNGIQLAMGCNYPSIDQPGDIVEDDAYYPHVSEGIDAYARNEFQCLSSMEDGGSDLLEPKSSFIHSIGLLPSDYANMAASGTSLIWSPRSNITLYGDTAVVTAAHRLGVRIALGTDWMPTGSMNLQRELACADSLNRDYYNSYFSDRELWRMVTEYGAQAAAVDDAIGSLAVGLTADIAIFDGSQNLDYRAIIDALASDVALVLRAGTAIYGDDALISALTASTCDAIDVCGTGKRICAMDDTGQSFAALQASANIAYPLFFCAEPDNEPSCEPVRTMAVNGSTIYSGMPGPTDNDGDGIQNDSDNCVAVFNPVRPVDNGAQGDFDGDGVGDACDPCPLDPDTSQCQPFDDNDLDSDGIENADDNCPRTPNTDQLDGDGDGKGDACDDCPATANPGVLACPATIYDIKQGQINGEVGVEDALVTGCSAGNGYFVQTVEGDPGYAGADYSGIYVYDPATECGTSVSLGDRVTLNPATVNVFFSQIQLTDAAIEILSSGNPAPTPVAVTSAIAGGDVPTALEAVLVRVENAIVTELEPTAGPGDNNPNNEFVVDDALRINDLMHRADPFPVVSAVYSSITGILNYRNGNSKLEPRDHSDLVLGAPILIDFAPGTTYVRVGATAAPTIPTPLTVTLSGPAEGDTFVGISSSDPASLTVVGGGATVTLGATSATVLVDGLAQNPDVTLTATLDAQILTASVRVVGGAEVPQVVSIAPMDTAVAPDGTVDMAVNLDIPATPVTGDLVDLVSNPGVSGSVPASVAVPADQISATFTFTANATEGVETVTASLGASSANATVAVSAVGGIVINEVNYDDPGMDTGEYIEIFNATGGTVDLTDLTLVLINGSNDLEYNRIDLAPANDLAPGEYLVIGTNAALMTVPPTAKTIALPAADNNVQNGGPDGLCIIDLGDDSLVDALSYEGSITAAQVNGIGTFNLVEGTATPAQDENAIDGALIRNPNGTDTDDAASDWAFSTTKTPGEANIP